MALTASDKIVRARALCAISQPFWAALMFSTPISPREDLPFKTAATDGLNIFYHPEFVDTLSVSEAQFLYAHELMHIMLQHCSRNRPDVNRRVMNMAQDYVINQMLRDEGFSAMPEGGLLDEKYRGMTAEQVYLDLMKKARKDGGKKDGGKKGGQSGGQDDGDDVADRLPQDCFGGDVMEQKTESAAQASERERQVRERVARAAQQAKMVGRLSANMERLVRGVVDPPQPWVDLLRDFAMDFAKNDFTWHVPNRRFHDIVMPSARSTKLGEIVFILDTSGSITPVEIAQAQAELQEMSDRLEPSTIRVVYCDSAVCGEQVFEQGDPVVIKPRGGGGTNMPVALKHVEQFEPAFVILMTDGYTPWCPEPPYPLIVCCTTPTPVPIGRVVRVRP